MRELKISDLYRLTDEQLKRLQPFFPKSHDKLYVDYHRVLIERYYFCQSEWPVQAGCARGIFTLMMNSLTGGKTEPQIIMIDATYLRAFLEIHG